MKNTISRFGVVIVVAIFMIGLIWLFQLRFEQGDIYPAYSSLRSDPLGTKALYQSFQECCGYSVSRNYETYEKRLSDSDAAILFLGLAGDDLDSTPEPLARQFDSFLLGGGRLVFVFAPVDREFKKVDFNQMKDEDSEIRFVSLSSRWGFEVQAQEGIGNLSAEAAEQAAADLPQRLTGGTILHFNQVDSAWRVLYRIDKRPVMMERKLRKGSIVVSTVSFFLSNEGLAKERQPELLLHLIGDKQRIVFDEYHHGVSNDPGVAYFIQKYKLGSTIIGLLLLAALFIWKNSVPFIPPDAHQAESTLTRGKDSIEGLANLLRRNVPSKQLTEVCWHQWKKGRSFFGKGVRSVSNNKVERIDSILHSVSADASQPELYNQITGILKSQE